VNININKGQRGMAIFIVLICLAVLVGMAAIFSYNMKVEMKLAANSNNETDMEWLGRSGVEYAKWILALEMTLPGRGQRFTALNQKWAGGTGETNDVLAGISMTDVPCGDGKFSIKITDAERKFNINSMAFNEALMNESLIQIGVDASEIPGIVSSIQDWIDPGDQPRMGGAKTEYYMGQNPPYQAKNAPIDDLSELMLIKGITPEIYWGPSSTNHPPIPLLQKTQIAPGGVVPTTPLISVGLADIFTTVSNGKLNINTCTASELRMIGMDESMASHVIALRAGPDGQDGNEDDVPFDNPGEIVNAVPPQLVQQFTPYLTTVSSTFEVRVDVEIGQSKRRYYALVRRNSPSDMQVLNFRWD
jgi:general secretion pathway protein K